MTMEHELFECFDSLQEDYRGNEANHLTLTWQPPHIIFTCLSCREKDPEINKPQDKYIEDRTRRFINIYEVYSLQRKIQ